MTIGIGTFLPSPGFAFPRSYVYEIAIANYGTTVTQAGEVFTIHAAPPNPTVAIIVFYEPMMHWSSNRYSLNFVVKEFYALVDGLPPQSPLNYTLSWKLHAAQHRATLQFEWYFLAPTFQYFPLAFQPSSYWMPPPLA